jgi:hypothetical protein
MSEDIIAEEHGQQEKGQGLVAVVRLLLECGKKKKRRKKRRTDFRLQIFFFGYSENCFVEFAGGSLAVWPLFKQ